MFVSPPLAQLPSLEELIEPVPLIVSPTTSVLEVIGLMNQIRYASCSLEVKPLAKTFQATASCALIVEDDRLLGILTERDIVNLSAIQQDLAQVLVQDVIQQPVVSLSLYQDNSLLSALNLFQTHKIRHLPVLDGQGQLIGVITPYSIRSVLQPASLLKLRRVAETMATEVIAVSPQTSVLQITQMMAAHQISCVAVVEQTDGSAQIPLGILTERDIVQLQVLQLNLAQMQVESVMSTPMFCLPHDASLWEAHQEMQHRWVRRLGITDETGMLVGLITQTDLLKVLDPVELSGVVNTLHQQLDAHTLELERVNQQLRQEQADLECRVQERTTALLQINSQLQREGTGSTG